MGQAPPEPKQIRIITKADNGDGELLTMSPRSIPNSPVSCCVYKVMFISLELWCECVLCNEVLLAKCGSYYAELHHVHYNIYFSRN